MTENDFFRHLEFRVCRELSGMEDAQLRRHWCDGFIPEEFVVVGNRCHLTGRVWMGDDSRNQVCWNFVLLLGNKALNRDAVEWAEVMPAEDVTGWLFMNFQTKFMEINPFAAYPDPNPVVINLIASNIDATDEDGGLKSRLA